MGYPGLLHDLVGGVPAFDVGRHGKIAVAPRAVPDRVAPGADVPASVRRQDGDYERRVGRWHQPAI